MERILKNSMREVWRRPAADVRFSPDIEVRKYSETNPNRFHMEGSFSPSSSIYWGRCSGQSFVIGAPLVSPFWKLIRGYEKSLSQKELEDLILLYARQSFCNIQDFTTEAAERYRSLEELFVQALPRDFRELSYLIGDPLVERAFYDVGISRTNIDCNFGYFSTYFSQRKQIMHGCFRFRNLWFDNRGKLFIVGGDDLVWGTELVAHAALLADLFDLSVSRVNCVRRPLSSLYLHVTSSLSTRQEDVLNRVIYLYVLAHHAQYIHTAQYKGKLSSLKYAMKIPCQGLLEAANLD
ncbi:hypothetical protein ABRP93_07915 [Corynebacterium sp. KPL2850]|uniref:hypothetical protein n=1 Tax=Corynebacterium sp. KPL2850 TaxID=3158318 RepID=UPI0032EBEB2E